MNGSLTDGRRGTTDWSISAADTGMVSATTWETYEQYTFPYSQWTAEIRFPIRQTPGYWTKGGGYPVSHGGLTDSDPVRQKEWDQYDPSKGDAGPGRPRYWWVNFARAEHPKKYTFADGSYEICPKNCTAALEHAVNVTPGYPTPKGGADLTCWPTILGAYCTGRRTRPRAAMPPHAAPRRRCHCCCLFCSVSVLLIRYVLVSSCPRVRLLAGAYWEWVWGPVGDAHPGVGYMHRPSSFPLVQFANESGEELCRNIEFPGRHIAKSLHLAQAEVCLQSRHPLELGRALSALLTRAVRCERSTPRCTVACTPRTSPRCSTPRSAT